VQPEKVDFVQFEASDTFGGTTLKCPQCGGSNLHPVSVSVHRGNDKTLIDSESITIKEEKNKTRGVTIIMEYCCEDQHDHGKLIFQFYKGNIGVHHEALKPFESYKDWNTLWRN